MYMQAELEGFNGKLVKVTLINGTVLTGIFHNMYRMGVEIGDVHTNNFFLKTIEVL